MENSSAAFRLMIHWLAEYPLLVLGELLLLVILFFPPFMRGVGLPWLFWGDSLRRLWWSGFAVGLVYAQVGLTKWLLDTGDPSLFAVAGKETGQVIRLFTDAKAAGVATEDAAAMNRYFYFQVHAGMGFFLVLLATLPRLWDAWLRSAGEKLFTRMGEVLRPLTLPGAMALALAGMLGLFRAADPEGLRNWWPEFGVSLWLMRVGLTAGSLVLLLFLAGRGEGGDRLSPQWKPRGKEAAGAWFSRLGQASLYLAAAFLLGYLARWYLLQESETDWVAGLWPLVLAGALATVLESERNGFRGPLVVSLVAGFLMTAMAKGVIYLYPHWKSAFVPVAQAAPEVGVFVANFAKFNPFSFQLPFSVQAIKKEDFAADHGIALWFSALLVTGVLLFNILNLATGEKIKRQLRRVVGGGFTSAYLCLLFALGVAFYGFVGFHSRVENDFGLWTFRIMATALPLLLLLTWRYGRHTHWFEGLPVKPVPQERWDAATKPVPEGKPASPMAPPHPQGWRRSGKPVAVAICTSGGGVRAATWTTGVLRRIEEELPGLLVSTRIIAGASGGMLGAAYLTGWKHLSRFHPELVAQGPEEMMDRVSGDSLNDAVGWMILRDLPTFPLRWIPQVRRSPDRGQLIEEAWRDQTEGALAVSFADLRESEKDGSLPLLVFSPMLVEDGRRLLVSNDDLSDLTSAGLGDGQGKASVQAVELRKLFPEAFEKGPDALRLSTAVRMSASFPYVTPAGELPIQDMRRRVVDAGYYDNYGVVTATEWLWHRRKDLLRDYGGLLLIQIRDGVIDSGSGESRVGYAKGHGAPPWEGISTPVESVATARTTATIYNNAVRVDALARYLNAASGDDTWAVSVPVEFSGTAALSWCLSSGELRDIGKSVRGPEVDEALEGIRAWLAGGAPPVGESVERLS